MEASESHDSSIDEASPAPTPKEGEGEARSKINKIQHYRNLTAYWLLGLCNNFGYVVMLSAAHDILSSSPSQTHHVTVQEAVNNTTRICNPTSTGAILLADIIPSLLAKLCAPFLPFYVHVRMVIVIALGVTGFVTVSRSTSELMAIIGVAFTSLGSGLGEVTLIAYSSKYHKNVISTWSSGTGAAGILGATSYASLTSSGITAANTLLIMLVVPFLMGFIFWIVLNTPGSKWSLIDWLIMKCRQLIQRRASSATADDQTPSTSAEPKPETDVAPPPPLSFKQKICILPYLMGYMGPLTLVYFFEYFINQGLFELISVPNIWINVHEQYRWLQVIYQIGVFLSRSSVNMCPVRKTWFLALFQGLNFTIFLLEAIYLYMKDIWVVFILVMWEGLLGGSAYVNTFYMMSEEVPYERKEFSLGIVSLSDAIGIGLAGIVSLPVHGLLCKLPKP